MRLEVSSLLRLSLSLSLSHILTESLFHEIRENSKISRIKLQKILEQDDSTLKEKLKTSERRKNRGLRKARRHVDAVTFSI